MRQRIATLAGAVDDEHLATRPLQGERDPLAHRAGTDDRDLASVETVEVIDRHLDRRLADRCRATPDGGLGADPLADHQRVAEEQVHRGACAALDLRDLPRLADLAEDLGLADHRRVEPGRDLEQVPDRGVVVMRVEMRVQLVGGDVADLAQEVADVGVGAVEALGDGVDLGAVARADQDDLAHVVAIGETTDGLGDLVRRRGQRARAR